jgi:septal ring factor EnvC (AmiA/AmiB activator)
VSPSETQEQLQSRVDELAAERAELWTALNERRAEERKLEDLQEEIAYLRSTVSWRITAPLRLGKRIQHQARTAWKYRG